MATEAQIQANRQNALHSTGPRTERGRAASSRNALKHGVHSRHLILPFENADEFRSLAAGLRQELDPRDLTESLIVENIVSLAWRLHRARTLETSLYYQNLGAPGPPQAGNELMKVTRSYLVDSRSSRAIDAVWRQESRLERMFYRALRHLDLLRARPSYPYKNLQNEPKSSAASAHANFSAPDT